MEITDKMIEAGMKLLGHSTPNKYDGYLVRAIFTAMLAELHGEFFTAIDDPEEGSTSVEDIVDRTSDGEFVHIEEHITLRRRVYVRPEGANLGSFLVADDADQLDRLLVERKNGEGEAA